MLGRAEPPQDAQVAAIHRQHQVELLEIALAEVPGPLRAQVIAAPLGMMLRPLVRRLADVIVVRAARLDVDFGALLLRQPAKDALRRRRAANVASADK